MGPAASLQPLSFTARRRYVCRLRLGRLRTTKATIDATTKAIPVTMEYGFAWLISRYTPITSGANRRTSQRDPRIVITIPPYRSIGFRDR